MGNMNIELLIVPGCPHERAAARLLRTAMDEVGLGSVDFRTVTVADPETAERIGFAGSPTFSVDGMDLFQDPSRSTALACRLYRHSGGLAGVPDLDDLRTALRATTGL